MRKAQIICLCLTLALFPALLAPAHAADAEGTPEPDMEIFGEVAVLPDSSDFLAEKPVISVRVPATGRVVMNPYHLDVALGGEVSREQIVSETYTMSSECDLPVTVSVSATGTVPAGSETVFVTAPPQDTGKEVFMYAEFREQYGPWQGYFTDASNQVMVTPWGESKTEVLTLAPWGGGYFRLFGTVSVPAGGMWTERDTVNVTLAFTFSVAETGGMSSTEPPAAVDGFTETPSLMNLEVSADIEDNVSLPD